ncbi:ATP-dependent DNA helicase PcrA [Candidatus Poribacteria bacterium]|nr:ATP-dependent DNA helicase PcrA [Candidatus Poribacteria bacterium]
MNSILENLNPVQKEAVQHIDGPLLLLSGAGSGKTRVITHRIAYLILEHGVSPLNILAVTFTNKAAEEMKKRLENLIGLASKLVWAATFHSSCARILRKDIDKFGYSSSFTIYDGTDQNVLMKEILSNRRFRNISLGAGAILNEISRAKERLMTYDDYAKMTGDVFEGSVSEVYKEYQTYLKTNNALDFDDLIMLTVQLFAEYPDVLEFYQEKFRYILVDEYQDTNHSQYQLIRMLAAKHKNICVVGDDDQCLPAGTLISTPNGQMPIEDVRWEDIVISASGRSLTHQAPVIGIHRKEYEGKLLKITTESGTTLRATPNHVLFASLSADENIHCVYLMYRRDKGYRIGISKGARSNGFKDRPLEVGIRQRCVQENADQTFSPNFSFKKKSSIIRNTKERKSLIKKKRRGNFSTKAWIIKICESRSEAQLWEEYYSIQYGIPTTVFDALGGANNLNPNQIDSLYSMIDTERNAQRLMRDLYIFHDYPHHRPKGISGNRLPDRQTVNFIMFSDKRRSNKSPWNAHRISLNTTDRVLEKQLQIQGHSTREGRRNTWRVEQVKLNYNDALKLANLLSEASGGLDIAQYVFLVGNKKYSFHPASHIHPTMLVAIEKDGQIVEDKVKKVEWENYRGYVYDLDVAELHNYIANGVVVHNSIYSWRGADIRNILDFEKDYDEIKTLRLEQNYRSTKNILEAAYEVVRNNRYRKEKKLWTENEEGDSLFMYEAGSENDEAEFVAKTISNFVSKDGQYSDIAVFYRVHAQSRAIEDALRRANIPYIIVGGVRFYERMEVKDVLAYLRVLVNPMDSISLKRIINVPRRGIGDTTMQRLEIFAAMERISLFDALKVVEQIDDIRPNTKAIISQFVKIMESFDLRERPAVIVEQLLNKTKYLEELKKTKTIEAQSRAENVGELVTAVKDYEQREESSTLAGFLENIALVADIDKFDETVDRVALMTLHSAKGLEFPIVFITGFEEGLLPYYRAFNDDAEMEEERRLCYVGMTRAKKQVYLTRASQRELFNIDMNNPPSQFIDEIPSHLIDSPGATTTWMRASEDDGEEELNYQVGDRVSHAKWGRGQIVNVNGRGMDMRVTVKFDRGMKKVLMMEYANLKKI